MGELDNPVAVAWLAGIVEGEGCIHIRSKERSRGVALIVAMTDEDIVARVHNIAGAGTVRQLAPRRHGYKTLHTWKVTYRHDVAAILNALLPHLGNRRSAKARSALDNISKMNERRRDGTHGTLSGWKREHSRGEPHCQACVDAYRKYNSEKQRIHRFNLILRAGA